MKNKNKFSIYHIYIHLVYLFFYYKKFNYFITIYYKYTIFHKKLKKNGILKNKNYYIYL